MGDKIIRILTGERETETEDLVEKVEESAENLVLQTLLAGLSKESAAEIADVVFRDRMMKHTRPDLVATLSKMHVDIDSLAEEYLASRQNKKK